MPVLPRRRSKLAIHWGNKPRQENRRVDYAPIVTRSSRVDNRPKRLSGVGYSVALLIVGVGLVLVQHFFYTYLDEKAIDSTSVELPPLLKDQNSVNFIGTSIAHGVRIALSMCAGVTVVQLLWAALRSKANTIERIDALIRCQTSPICPSILLAATTSLLVVVTSLVASGMAFVVIFSPGSLAVVTDFRRTRLCEVFTVPTAVDSNCSSSVPTQQAISLNVLAANTYVPPLLLNNTTPCGESTSTCAYDVSFHGPAVDCVDTTAQTNFSQLIHPTVLPAGATTTFFDVSPVNKFENNSLAIDVLTNDLARAAIRSTRCTPYNATYEARVSFTSGEGSRSGSTVLLVQVQNISLHSELVELEEMPFINTYANTAILYVSGTIYAGPSGLFTGGMDTPEIIQTSQFIGTTSSGNFTFNDNIIHFFESYMQNVSISLLSGNVYYCLSNDTQTNLQRTNTTCYMTFPVYNYNSARLFATYGIALSMTGLVFVIGCRLIMREGEEERLLFSQVVRISLNEELFMAAGKLEEKTQLLIERNSCGDPSYKIFPRLSEEEIINNAPVGTSYELEESAHKAVLAPWTTLWNKIKASLSTYKWKSALLIISSLVCTILQDVYYSYLDGITPKSPSGLSSWLTDQTVASDLGITLAVAVQSLLSSVITIACTQQFWRSNRWNVHTISEINALVGVQDNPFSSSALSAFRASCSVPFLSFLAASMTLISIFVPGSIKISSNYVQSRECTVANPKDLSILYMSSNSNSIFWSPIMVALSSGSNLPPLNPCHLGDAVECSYNLSFIGPGLDCQDVTASSNQTAFTTPAIQAFDFSVQELFVGSMMSQNESLTMNLSVQTWDQKNAIYSATNCVGVLRSYSVVVSHTNNNSAIDIVESSIESVVRANITQLSTTGGSFLQCYLMNIMSVVQNSTVNLISGGDGEEGLTIESYMANIFAVDLDGNAVWNRNMPSALEAFAENAALGVLSGQIFTSDHGYSSVLRNQTTTCTYTFPAYEYTPFRLFLTYGIAIFITVLCAIWGAYAMRQNGAEESMDFSRILRAVLNEKMFYARESLDKDTKVINIEGDFVPLLS